MFEVVSEQRLQQGGGTRPRRPGKYNKQNHKQPTFSLNTDKILDMP